MKPKDKVIYIDGDGSLKLGIMIEELKFTSYRSIRIRTNAGIEISRPADRVFPATEENMLRFESRKIAIAGSDAEMRHADMMRYSLEK